MVAIEHGLLEEIEPMLIGVVLRTGGSLVFEIMKTPLLYLPERIWIRPLIFDKWQCPVQNKPDPLKR